ncbi:MAG TPA: hypothetical protein VHU87_02415, partial [Rhizomicrobium sp.]|nr:hypothetical protein [Rhizomicrobium sp.]
NGKHVRIRQFHMMKIKVQMWPNADPVCKLCIGYLKDVLGRVLWRQGDALESAAAVSGHSLAKIFQFWPDQYLHLGIDVPVGKQRLCEYRGASKETNYGTLADRIPSQLNRQDEKLEGSDYAEDRSKFCDDPVARRIWVLLGSLVIAFVAIGYGVSRIDFERQAAGWGIIVFGVLCFGGGMGLWIIDGLYPASWCWPL